MTGKGIDRLEARVAGLEAAKLASVPSPSDSRLYLDALGCFFDPKAAKIWRQATEDERRLFWPAYEVWRILTRLDELGVLTNYMDCRAKWDHQKFEAWVVKYCDDGSEDRPDPEEGPITCEDLHSVKETIRSWQWDFAEFGVNKARQVGHLYFYGKTEEAVREARIRMAEAGSLPPDVLPAYGV